MVLVEDCPSAFGAISIFRRRQTGATIFDQLGSRQSEADVNGVSLAAYIHAIYGLVLQCKARNVLMIGCGGGTLATMLCRAGSKIVIADINVDSFRLARRYFGLPEQVQCHVADGAQFLLTDAGTYDVIVLDAFIGDHVPLHLRSIDFFQSVRKRLDANGCVFSNIHVTDDGDGAADLIAEEMSRIWSDVRLLDSPGSINRNAIAMAGRVGHLTPPMLRVRPEETVEEIESELESMRFRSWRDVS